MYVCERHKNGKMFVVGLDNSSDIHLFASSCNNSYCDPFVHTMPLKSTINVVHTSE